MALGSALRGAMESATVGKSPVGAAASESVSFIGDRGKKKKKGGKKVMLGSGRVVKKTSFSKCYKPNH